MIETMFEPFDFTTGLSDKDKDSSRNTTPPHDGHPESPNANRGSADGGEHKQAGTPIQTRSRSNTQTPNGSPPLHTAHDQQAQRRGPPRSVPPDMQDNQGDVKHPEKLSKKGTTRVASGAGGSQYILHPTGSWSDLQHNSNHNNHNESDDDEKKRPSGMLGFLSRKKGRDRSPKARERGVLGKEGARVVISNG